jgi:hypothetical protein
MYLKYSGWHGRKPPIEGSALPVLALIALAAFGAALALWMRNTAVPSGTELSPSSGMPAVPQPHGSGQADTGV